MLGGALLFTNAPEEGTRSLRNGSSRLASTGPRATLRATPRFMKPLSATAVMSALSYSPGAGAPSPYPWTLTSACPTPAKLTDTVGCEEVAAFYNLTMSIPDFFGSNFDKLHQYPGGVRRAPCAPLARPP